VSEHGAIPVSVIVMTKNEADNIGPCITALRAFDEIWLLAGSCGCRRASGGRRDRRSAGQMTPRARYLRRAPESSAIDASPTGREAKVPICSVVGVA
jgi:hypothetical protein